MSVRRSCVQWLVVLSAALAAPQFAQAQGLQLWGIGPVNRSMGGAATAAPIEAIGATAFNPATLSALSNQLSVGAELVNPQFDISSSLGGPSGNTSSDCGFGVIPSLALSWRPEPESPITYGFGLFGVAGYSVNLPASTTNPILAPHIPPTPGFGNLYVDVNFLQIAPSISVQVTDQLSVAVGPTVMAGRLIASPFPFTSANSDGTYPVGAGTEFAWGLGFQVGAFWKGDNNINLGASFKSPNWFQDLKYNGIDSGTGAPRSFTFDFDYPMIVSLGAAYTGVERLLLACDVRYFDWDSSGRFGDSAQFSLPSGELTGLGWRSVWAVAFGAQYELTSMLALRAGYQFAQSPVEDSVASYNIGSPLIMQHSINVGGTVKLTERLALNAAYYYAPEAEVSGPIQLPGGAVPGSNVNYRVSAHSVSAGLTVMF